MRNEDMASPKVSTSDEKTNPLETGPLETVPDSTSGNKSDDQTFLNEKDDDPSKLRNDTDTQILVEEDATKAETRDDDDSVSNILRIDEQLDQENSPQLSIDPMQRSLQSTFDSHENLTPRANNLEESSMNKMAVPLDEITNHELSSIQTVTQTTDSKQEHFEILLPQFSNKPPQDNIVQRVLANDSFRENSSTQQSLFVDSWAGPSIESETKDGKISSGTEEDVPVFSSSECETEEPRTDVPNNESVSESLDKSLPIHESIPETYEHSLPAEDLILNDPQIQAQPNALNAESRKNQGSVQPLILEEREKSNTEEKKATFQQKWRNANTWNNLATQHIFRRRKTSHPEFDSKSFDDFEANNSKDKIGSKAANKRSLSKISTSHLYLLLTASGIVLLAIIVYTFMLNGGKVPNSDEVLQFKSEF